MNNDFLKHFGSEDGMNDTEPNKIETTQSMPDSDNSSQGDYFELGYDDFKDVQGDKPQQSEYDAQPQRTYENVYSSSSTQPRREAYTNPYANPSQQYGGYSDGFYQRSYNDNSSAGSGYSQPGYSKPVQQQYQPAQQEEKKKRSGGLSKGAVAALLVVCILLSGIAGFGGSMIASQINKDKNTEASETMIIHRVDTEAQPAGTENLTDKSTSEITSEVADTVVEITTEVMQTNAFYGQYIAQGAGSGVIISDDGYILTNNHVIEDASSIQVTTRDGKTYDAELIGTDSEVDIAILKIDATGLKSAVFGDSDKLEVGSKAVIIGNPLGTLGGSVTEGIISALDRSIVIDGKTMHLMQTDAAINPGNSGGGMFNGQGELTGIVVAKSSSTSESTIDNIGFVIPINTVLDILGDLKDYGYVRGRADTGMSYIDLTNQMYAWYYYGNSTAGVYINSVNSGSNAYEAGFREGDRVISVDGKEISEAADIDKIISEKSVGDKVTFELERKGSSGSIELTLEERVPQKSNTSSNSDKKSNNPIEGIFG